MTKFNLQLAKEGNPVCTTIGDKVEILKFDLANDMPIVAIVTDDEGMQEAQTYGLKGNFFRSGESSLNDLMMV